MNRWTDIRRWLFRAALGCLAISVSVYVLSWVRPVRTQDYLEQARQAVPWINAGLIFALFALLLSFFGKHRARIASAVGSALVFCFWILIAESNF